MEIIADVEDMLVKYCLLELDNEQKKDIHDGEDVLKCMKHDAEEDVKEHLWYLVKAEVDWRNVVQRVKDTIKEEDSEEECSDEENEDVASTT